MYGLTRTALIVLAVFLASACDRNEAAESNETVAANEGVAPNQETAANEGAPMAEQRGLAQDENGLNAAEPSDERQDASELANDAADTLRKMKAEPKLRKLLSRSKGVFIVPHYGRAAVGVGARGGQGVLLAHHHAKWCGPAFYDVGGVSVGAQLGAEGGEIAMLLMSKKALDSFESENNFSLNAGAKLTVVNYSGLGEASAGKDVGDVVFWSDTEGAFAGATLSATDISWDDEENSAYYGGKQVTAKAIIKGDATAPESTLRREAKAI